MYTSKQTKNNNNLTIQQSKEINHSKSQYGHELLGTGSGRLESGQEGTLEGFGGVTSK